MTRPSNTPSFARASMAHAEGIEGLARRSAQSKARPVRALLLAALIGLVGCAGPQADGSTGESSPSSPTPSPVATTPAPEETQGPRAEVVEAYQQYLDATAEAMAAGDADLPGLRDIALDQALAAAQARVAALAAQDRVARGELVQAVQDVEVDDGAATIRDCYSADITEHEQDSGEQVASRDGVRFAATAELTRQDGQWVVVSFEEGDTCVPSALAGDIEQRYVAFWDAVVAAGRPPDPDHPALPDVAAGEQLEGLRERLAEFRDQGYEVRDESVAHPTATRISHDDTRALVRDCRELDPEGGVYDATTGELVDGGAEPGQRSLWEAKLELIDGAWKVVDADVIEEDSACAPAPS